MHLIYKRQLEINVFCFNKERLLQKSKCEESQFIMSLQTESSHAMFLRESIPSRLSIHPANDVSMKYLLTQQILTKHLLVPSTVYPSTRNVPAHKARQSPTQNRRWRVKHALSSFILIPRFCTDG